VRERNKNGYGKINEMDGRLTSLHEVTTLNEKFTCEARVCSILM
jgi:hypothetical protein